VKPIDINPKNLETVRRILRQHVPEVEVRAFGSRVAWSARDTSDLDLVLMTDVPLPVGRMADLKDAFTESNLPFKVDILDWATTKDRFRRIIEKQYVMVQKGDGKGGGMAGEWHTATLADTPLEIIDGDRGNNYPKQADFNSTGYCLFLNAGNVTSNGFNSSSCAFISAEKDATLRKGKLRRHDVVLTTRGTVGNVAYFDDSVPFENIRINSGMVILRSSPSALLPRFLYLFVRSATFQDQVSFLRTGSAQPQLPIRDINRIEITLPPLPEQRAIAHILGTLDDKIELNRRMSETLEAMARALFKSWFVDFDPVRAKAEGRNPGIPKHIADLFPDRLVGSELGEIPEGWRVETVGEHMVNFDSKRVPVSKAKRSERQGPYPYHGAAGVMDYVDDYLFDGVHLLVGEDGSVVQNTGIGVTQYVWGKIWVNNHAHVLKGLGAVSTEQLYLYFRFEPVAPYVTGAVQPKLSQGRMNAMPFVFAGDTVCRAFGETVKSWFERLRANFDETKTLAALRDTLLPKLISGELRIEDAERILKEKGW